MPYPSPFTPDLNFVIAELFQLEKVMATKQNIRLGLLSPATPNRPHFKHVDNLLPPGVSLIHEGLGLLGESYQDLVGKADQVIALATDFVKRNEVEGLILTGGFIGLFN